MEPITVSHFSDIFCVWAYVAQARIDELEKHFEEQVRLEYHFFSVFGSIKSKIQNGWGHRGGIQGYAKHVLGVGERYEYLKLHPDVWTKTIPESSMQVHLFLCAVLLSQEDAREGHRRVGLTAQRLRRGFFCDCRDISKRSVQLEIAEEVGLPRAEIEAALDDGRAFAVLHEDLERAREEGIRVSPTLLFNEGRQRLTGNVGYRVIEANVREVLQTPDLGELASWC